MYDIVVAHSIDRLTLEIAKLVQLNETTVATPAVKCNCSAMIDTIEEFCKDELGYIDGAEGDYWRGRKTCVEIFQDEVIPILKEMHGRS